MNMPSSETLFAGHCLKLNFKQFRFALLAIFALGGGVLLTLLLFPQDAFAANRYWVGSAGGNTNDTANWASADPASCTGGGASVPSTGDVAIFDADCDNGATVDAALSVLGLTINSGYAGTITQSSTVTIGTSSFSMAAGTWTAGAVTFDDNGSFTLSGGTFTAPNASGSFTVAGNFTKSGSPTFNANSGTLTLDGDLTSSTSIDASGVTFNKIVINRTGLSSDLTFTIYSGTTVPLGNSPTVALSNPHGDYVYHLTNNGTITMGTGTGTFNVEGIFTNAGTITADSLSSFVVSYVTVKPYGGFTNSGSISMTSATSFNFNASFTNSGTATFSTGASPTMSVAGSLTVANTSTFPTNVALTLDSSGISL